jgi:uncharacterized protein (TIGR00251 family)
MSCFRRFDGGLELLVWVAPRASRPALGPLHGERLRVAVSAPPVDGAANEALRRLIADSLDVPRGAVAIVQGESSRQKTVRVNGDATILLSRLKSHGVPLAAAEETDGTSRKR